MIEGPPLVNLPRYLLLLKGALFVLAVKGGLAPTMHSFLQQNYHTFALIKHYSYLFCVEENYYHLDNNHYLFKYLRNNDI